MAVSVDGAEVDRGTCKVRGLRNYQRITQVFDAQVCQRVGWRRRRCWWKVRQAQAAAAPARRSLVVGNVSGNSWHDVHIMRARTDFAVDNEGDLHWSTDVRSCPTAFSRSSFSIPACRLMPSPSGDGSWISRVPKSRPTLDCLPTANSMMRSRRIRRHLENVGSML
jgi:hypothetical protein